MRVVGNQRNWPDKGRYCIMPSDLRFLLDTSDLTNASFSGNSKSLLLAENKFLGNLCSFDLYDSNLYTPITDDAGAVGQSVFPIIFGHMDAVCFVSQLVDVSYFADLQATAGSGMAGTNLYDWKVIAPKQLGMLYATLAIDMD